MLKGKTIIELTDVNTGKKETYEDHNMVTQAINEIILKRKKYLYPNDGGTGKSASNESTFYNMFPLYKGFFGGLMLFQNTIDESRMFINGDDVVIGSATVGNAYSGLDPQIGSYNQTESEINTTEKYAKFVYDFATNQGNGTISAVCLANYHYVYHCLYGKDYSGDRKSLTCVNELLFTSNGEAARECINGKSNLPQICLFPTMRQTGTFEAATGYQTPVVYDEEKGHLIIVQFVGSEGTPTYSSPVNGIKFKVYDLGLSSCTLFGGFLGDDYKAIQPILIHEKEFTIPICGNYSVYNMQANGSKFAYYDESDGCVYVLGDSKNTSAEYWNANDIFTVFKFDLNVTDYESITMQTIEVTNKSGKQLKVATTWKSQLTGHRNVLIKDGYLYAGVYYNSASSTERDKFVKIKITDSTDVTVFDVSGDFSNQSYGNGLICDCGDMIYWGSENYANTSEGSDYIVKMLNTKTNTFKYTRAAIGFADSKLKPIPIKGNSVFKLMTTASSYVTTANSNPMAWVGVFASRNDYLATINNLDTPVTKTSDKTMKITYVLRGE